MTSQRILTVCCLGALALACSSQQAEKPPVSPGATTTEPTQAQVSSDDADSDLRSDQSGIRVSKDIMELCQLESKVDDPNFGYDSAQLRSVDRDQLSAIANCATKGALSGRTLLLVGHADPRGDEEYNLVLGDKRAATIEGFLTSRGVPQSNIQTSSRGEMDARGSGPSTWFEDRRVDILLAD